LGPSCPCHRYLTLRVEGLLSADRAKEDRALPRDTEHFRAQIGLGDIDKVARAQLDVLEAGKVGPERVVVIHTGCQIAPVCRRKRLACGFLEIHHT